MLEPGAAALANGHRDLPSLIFLLLVLCASTFLTRIHHASSDYDEESEALEYASGVDDEQGDPSIDALSGVLASAFALGQALGPVLGAPSVQHFSFRHASSGLALILLGDAALLCL